MKSLYCSGFAPDTQFCASEPNGINIGLTNTELCVMNRILPFLFLIFLSSSCKKMFVYHPNEVRPDETDMNAKNIAKLAAVPPASSFSFILIGDTQRFYDELDDFVKMVNDRDDVTFVVLDGDLTDFGLNFEYNQVAQRLNQIRIPVISVLGNHDMLANGTQIFRKMFGPENFTFSYSNTKFVALNTNSRETDFDGTVPDINWMQKEVDDDDGFTNVFVVSHVAPFSTDFDKSLEPAYQEVIRSNPKARLSLHAHEHSWALTQPYEDDVDYLQVGYTGERNYALVSVNGEKHTIEKKYY
ncbi:MAG: metallophosphoesterase [Chitinophagaceae bacterium]|nr:MAG: metallophosphoesterase [Chitinophagaceae bacterium]